MQHVFSCKGYSKAEALFPPIVNLTSSMVHNGAGNYRRLKNATNCDRNRTSARELA